MELTAQEREAIEKGDVVRYLIPDSQVECVVVREDLLDPLRVRSDYAPCDPDDLARLTSEVLDDEDWSTPEDPATPQPS
ncbi:MAG: hypothetical protein ABR915_21190 [Thermoguttaceae bacterium]|jgi:hypothetical protein